MAARVDGVVDRAQAHPETGGDSILSPPIPVPGGGWISPKRVHTFRVPRRGPIIRVAQSESQQRRAAFRTRHFWFSLVRHRPPPSHAVRSESAHRGSGRPRERARGRRQSARARAPDPHDPDLASLTRRRRA
jgi:hypothetical protein